MEKVYLITGAGSEVGMAYIKRLMEVNEEATVIAVYRNMSDSLNEIITVDSLVDVVAIKADLSISNDVEMVINCINDEELKPTHMLHLAAGEYEFAKIKDWDEEKAKTEMQIGLYSFARFCSEYLPAMAKAKYGKVAAVLSAVTLGTPPKFVSRYATVKYALLGFIRSAAAEYADKGLNINGVSPAMMETKFLKNIDERIVEMAAANAARKRNVNVSETVDAIEYLLSDKASYINGENLNLSGGDYM